MTVVRGEVYTCDLSMGVGSEQGGYRPVVIVSSDMGNKRSPNVIVVPLSTTKKQVLGTHVMLSAGELIEGTRALCEGVRAISKGRLEHYVCKLSEDEMNGIESSMKFALGMYGM